MTQDEAKAIASVIERLTENARQRVEEAGTVARADAVKRAETDRVVIEGLRADLAAVRAVVKEQSDHAKDAGTLLGWAPNESAFQAAQRVVKERDGLLAQVQDQRAEIERLRADIAEELNESPPAPPEASHDTTAGKEAAESVIRDFRTTEPAADIKDGDIVEVVSATHKIYTEYKDLGRRGVVTAIDGMRVSVGAVPGYELPIRGIVGKCDVRKVTT